MQSAIAKMSPSKFEQFSRALLTKMGVQFTSKSVQISNDGGIEAMNKYQADYGVFITNSRLQIRREKLREQGHRLL